MQLLQCDRCEKNVPDTPNTTAGWLRVERAPRPKSLMPSQLVGDLDLCPTCARALADFLDAMPRKATSA